MQKTGKKNKRIKLKENKTRNKSGSEHRWIFLVTAFSFIISGSLLYTLSGIISSINVFVSIIFVLIIILIGIFADMIGIAVAAADETQFHAMAAKRIRGSMISIKLIRHANKVSSVMNDVIGDICGVISGSISAILVIYIAAVTKSIGITLLGVIFSGLVAALTIGGKAIGKTVAIRKSNNIVYRTAILVTLVYPEKWGKNTK
jgi:CBS domain containing-hemolysin-like protein